MRALRCDAFASGCHKWLYGPRGTGVLWAGERVRELARPTIPSFDDGVSYGAWLAGSAPSGTPTAPDSRPVGSTRSSTAGRSPRPSLPRVDRARASRGEDPNTRLAPPGRAWRTSAACALRTPSARALSAGLVCFDVEGRQADEVVARLAAARHRRERHALRPPARPARPRDRQHRRRRRRRDPVGGRSLTSHET